MLGRAARDLELPEAYLFTKGEPGIDEKAIKARIGLMPVKLFHDGARCLGKLFELARAKMNNEAHGVKISKADWCQTWGNFKYKNYK